MGAASADEEIRKSAQRSLRVCILALEQMALAWMWSRRALRAVRLLAKEWLIPGVIPGRESDGDGDGDTLPRESVEGTVGDILDTKASALPPEAEYWTGTELDPIEEVRPVPEADIPVCDFDPVYLGLDDTDWLSSLNSIGELGSGFDSTQADPWVTSALSQYSFQDLAGIPELAWPTEGL